MNTTDTAPNTITEKDLRERFDKVQEEIQKTLREVEVPSVLSPMTNELVIEPVYIHRVHASS